MKIIQHWHTIRFISISLCFIFLSACSGEAALEESQHQVTDVAASQQQTKALLSRLGEIPAQELIRDYPKFAQSYQDFEPLPNDINNFSRLKGMDIVVFFGLWCHDSQREVPRLIKLIEQSGNQFNSVKLIAVNHKKELSQAYAEQFKVAYTPTIFVLKDQQILARVVEKPRATLAQDILGQILH